jgi:hypothetical protein
MFLISDLEPMIDTPFRMTSGDVRAAGKDSRDSSDMTETGDGESSVRSADQTKGVGFRKAHKPRINAKLVIILILILNENAVTNLFIF